MSDNDMSDLARKSSQELAEEILHLTRRLAGCFALITWEEFLKGPTAPAYNEVLKKIFKCLLGYSVVRVWDLVVQGVAEAARLERPDAEDLIKALETANVASLHTRLVSGASVTVGEQVVH